MRGTTSLLRLLLGRGLGTDYDGEFLRVGAERVHLFECFALVNFLLCSAVCGEPTEYVEGESKSGAVGRSTPTMQRNCATHYRQTIEILQPTVIVAQGKAVRHWMKRVIDQTESVDPICPVEKVRVGSWQCYLATFAHPAARPPLNWGMNTQQPYLLKTVVPTLEYLLDGLPACDCRDTDSTH